MAQYFEDWSGSTIGQAPAGWTPRLVADAAAWGVIDIGGGQKALRHYTGVTGAARNGLSFDAIDADADRANFEVVFKWRVDTIGQYGPQLKGWGRASGSTSASSQSAYLGGVDASVDQALPLRLQKYVNGTSSTIGTSQAFELTTNTWYITRFRVNGTTLQQKTWLASESEPGSWLRTETDTSVSSAGWVGLFSFNSAYAHDVEWVGVATAGDTAPMTGGSDTTAPTLTSPTATATGATTASGSVTTNEANGTLYYIASANATESAATVKAGGSQAVSDTGVQAVSFTGLSAGTSYYPHYLHRDAAGNDSTVASGGQFTTTAAGDTTNPTLTGAVTFTDVTQTGYTPNWPVGSDNVSIGGYEYQIGSTAGAWTDVGNNLSVAVTGRTAGTTETVYVRAYDTSGNRSAAISGQVTTASVVVVKGVVQTLYLGDVPQANLTGLRALWWDAVSPDGTAPDYYTATASTDASGVLTLDIDATTALSVGDYGYLHVHKAGTLGNLYKDALVFAGAAPVEDIA